MTTNATEEEYYSLIKRAFDALAPVYDFIAIPLAGLREKVVSFTGAADGARILDVATGTGEQALEALLGKTGIEIEAKLSALLGAGRIVKGSKMV